MMTRRLRPLASGFAGTHTRCAASSFHADLSCEFHAARSIMSDETKHATYVRARAHGAASAVPFSKHSTNTCCRPFTTFQSLLVYDVMTVRLE